VDLWKNKAFTGGDDLRAAYQDYLTETKKKYGLPPTMVEEGTTMTKREIEPPLRGAAPQEFLVVSVEEEQQVGLRLFSRPLPLVEDDTERHLSAFGAIKHHHTKNKGRHADDDGRMLHELQNEFDTWARRSNKISKHFNESGDGRITTFPCRFVKGVDRTPCLLHHPSNGKEEQG